MRPVTKPTPNRAARVRVDQARRMYAEALTRLNDAEVLAQSARTQSDAPQLLSILGFEVLLKCALHLCDVPASYNHEYADLWQKLPPKVRAQVLAVARARMFGHADLKRLRRILDAHKHVFMRARYYYELSAGLTARQVRAKGRAWIKRGARNWEAEVKYYPSERECLIAGLRVFIESQLPPQRGRRR
jgi:hypothetical protein